MSYSGIVRTLGDGPWHYCARCDDKTKIRDLQWQRGLLLCPSCFDTALLGEREVYIAKVLEDGREELDIDPKLTTPDTETNDDNLY